MTQNDKIDNKNFFEKKNCPKKKERERERERVRKND